MEHHVGHASLVDFFKILEGHDELLIIKADEMTKIEEDFPRLEQFVGLSEMLETRAVADDCV